MIGYTPGDLIYIFGLNGWFMFEHFKYILVITMEIINSGIKYMKKKYVVSNRTS